MSRTALAKFPRPATHSRNQYGKGGKAVLTAHSRVSADGKTVTVNVKGTDAQGKPVDAVAGYDKFSEPNTDTQYVPEGGSMREPNRRTSGTRREEFSGRNKIERELSPAREAFTSATMRT